MKWLRWQRQSLPSDEVEAAQREAERARKDAENLARRVEHVAGKLQETQRRNHIAESVELAIRPRRQA